MTFTKQIVIGASQYNQAIKSVRPVCLVRLIRLVRPVKPEKPVIAAWLQDQSNQSSQLFIHSYSGQPWLGKLFSCSDQFPWFIAIRKENFLIPGALSTDHSQNNQTLRMWLMGCPNPYKMQQSWEYTFLKVFTHTMTK